MPQLGWYYRLSSFFKEKFGERIYKIPLDAGLTCPNRDGTVSREGCIYCYNPSFSPGALEREKNKEESRSITSQILSFQLKKEKKKAYQPQGGEAGEVSPEKFSPQYKYLAYFQSFSNTYGPPSYLQKLYEEALFTPGVTGLSIATRPDCLDDEVLKVLENYARDYHIWLELGLQSVHDRTLKLINRGHDFACFETAVKRSAEKGIYTCAHIINGLPGENFNDMLETVKVINQLPLNGIKFHQLQVIKHTKLHDMYLKGKVQLLEKDEYLDILCDQLEHLRSDIVVHRLLSEAADADLLVAPFWHWNRASFAQQVEKELSKRGSCQGKESLSMHF